MKNILLFQTITAVIGLSACTKDENSLENVVKAEKNDESHEFTVDENGKVNFELEIVYFEFDDHLLTKEGRERLAKLADYLEEHKDKKLNVSGHCDERGSTEYNLALGQSRAESVRNYLQSLGVSNERLETISFGEEKPAAEGSSEVSWRQNRRAEFLFVNK